LSEERKELVSANREGVKKETTPSGQGKKKIYDEARKGGVREGLQSEGGGKGEDHGIQIVRQRKGEEGCSP